MWSPMWTEDTERVYSKILTRTCVILISHNNKPKLDSEKTSTGYNSKVLSCISAIIYILKSSGSKPQ